MIMPSAAQYFSMCNFYLTAIFDNQNKTCDINGIYENTESQKKCHSKSFEIATCVESIGASPPTFENEDKSCSYPSCWSYQQYTQKCQDYGWLFGRNGKLGCSICLSVKSVKLQQSQGIKLANEWINCSIEPYGKTHEDQRQSLRTKIFELKKSKAHEIATNIAELSKKDILEESNKKNCELQHLTTSRVFRTTYKIAKRERPFTDLPGDIELQQMNGLDLGRVLHSDRSCADIVSHIGREMRRKLVEDIIHNNSKISVLIDEATSVSGKTVLTVCMRAVVSGSADPVTFF